MQRKEREGFREMQAMLFPAPVPLHRQGPCPKVPVTACVFPSLKSQLTLPLSEVFPDHHPRPTNQSLAPSLILEEPISTVMLNCSLRL